MAEFCKDCFLRIEPNMRVIEVSNDLDLCEGCGEYKQIVIETEPNAQGATN